MFSHTQDREYSPHLPGEKQAAVEGPLLSVEGLTVKYSGVTVVDDVSLTVALGEKVAIVGQSGSGKSTVIGAIMQLLPRGAEVSGRISFDGREISGASAQTMRRLLGDAIGYVPQDPMSNLNPVHRVGPQLIEAVRAHRRIPKRQARESSEEALRLAGLENASERFDQFPHEFSGGMRQRALIAMGSINDPKLIIADEPTSALDVTVQKVILDNLDEKLSRGDRSMIIVTHDLGLAAERADRVIVMNQGRIVEAGQARQVFVAPRDAYTRRLVDAAPLLSLEPSGDRQTEPAGPAGPPLLEFDDVSRSFPLRRRRRGASKTLHAVRKVSFEVHRGRTLAVVGESGSGKSTCANMALRLDSPSSGEIRVDGMDTTRLAGPKLRGFRRRVQAVFQDPFSSLDPLKNVRWILEEPFQAFREGDRKSWKPEIERLVDLVRLPSTVLARTARELSGGQRQRVAIARALALRPELVVCDEPVSALDVLVQSQILDVLKDIQTEFGLSYLFISHDLAVVQQIADDIIVMRHGRIEESGPISDVLGNPSSAYTRMLIDAVPGRNLRTSPSSQTEDLQ